MTQPTQASDSPDSGSPGPALAQTRILVTNDDGIHAPGIGVLADLARAFSSDVWVVAPHSEQSGSGHSLTLDRPLRIRQHEERRWSVDGTPTDCVLLAVRTLMKDHPPDLVVSGVNLGGNYADHVTYSGTIAAAMEATLLGIPAIAFSLAVGWESRPDWSSPEKWVESLVRTAWQHPWTPGVLLNINFPNLPADQVTGLAVTPTGLRVETMGLQEIRDPRGRRRYWIGGRGDPLVPDGQPDGQPDVNGESDMGALRAGRISITPLHMNLTHQPSIERMQAMFRNT